MAIWHDLPHVIHTSKLDWVTGQLDLTLEDHNNWFDAVSDLASDPTRCCLMNMVTIDKHQMADIPIATVGGVISIQHSQVVAIMPTLVLAPLSAFQPHLSGARK